MIQLSFDAVGVTAHVLLFDIDIIPKKVKGDRDRRPFWAGGENEVARRVLAIFGES